MSSVPIIRQDLNTAKIATLRIFYSGFTPRVLYHCCRSQLLQASLCLEGGWHQQNSSAFPQMSPCGRRHLYVACRCRPPPGKVYCQHRAPGWKSRKGNVCCVLPRRNPRFPSQPVCHHSRNTEPGHTALSSKGQLGTDRTGSLVQSRAT